MGRGYGDVSGYSGVTQDSNNYVVRLNLPRNRMTGTLSATEALAYAMYVPVRLRYRDWTFTSEPGKCGALFVDRVHACNPR